MNVLKKNRIDGSGHYTHVSMGSISGKYALGRQSLEEFYSKYSKDIVKGVYKYGVAERPQYYTQLVADIDLKKLKKECGDSKELYTIDQVKQVVDIYQQVINEVVDDAVDATTMCVYLKKDPYISGDYIKNGFHLQFPNCFVDSKKHSEVIIPMVQKLMAESDVFSDYPKAIDTNTPSVNWLLYGSVKSDGLKPYLVSKIFDYDGNEIIPLKAFADYKIYDENENQIKISSEDDVVLNYYRILSINPYGRDTQEITKTFSLPQSETKIEKGSYPKLSDEESFKEAQSLMQLIDITRLSAYSDWFEIGCCLWNITGGSEEGLQLWDEFSKKCTEYTDGCCDRYWSSMKEGDLTVGTLKRYAKIDNPEGYKKLTKKSLPKKELNGVDTSDEGLATYFYEHCSLKYHSNRKVLYIFNEDVKLWTEIDKEVLRTQMIPIITPYIKNIKDTEQFTATLEELKSTPKQGKILVSLWSKILAGSNDTFIDINFDKSLGLFPIADEKVICLRNLEVRDRVKEDYFTRTTQRKFKADVDTDFVKTYLREILTTNRDEYVDWLLYVIGHCLTGQNNMKQFYILLGEKDTGKSLFLKLISLIFESWGGVVNDKVFKQSKTESVHNSEAFSLLEKRTAFVSELQETESFNEQLIKKISGGDDVNIRGCGSDKNNTVNFNCVLWLASNCLPKYTEDAFAERLRIVTFSTVFKNNQTRRDDILAHIDDFFTMACIMAKRYYDNGMKFGNVKEVMESTKSIIDERDKFKNWIDEEFYFIDKKYINNLLIENDDAEPRTKKSEVYANYIQWCCENNISGFGKITFYKKFQTQYGLPEYNDKKMWRGIRIK